MGGEAGSPGAELRRARSCNHFFVVSAQREEVSGVRIDIVDDRLLPLALAFDRRHALDVIGRQAKVSGLARRGLRHADVVLVSGAVGGAIIARRIPPQQDGAGHRAEFCIQGDVAGSQGITPPTRGVRRTGMALDGRAGAVGVVIEGTRAIGLATDNMDEFTCLVKVDAPVAAVGKVA